MIDIENEVFSKLKKAIQKAHHDAYVTGEYVRTPPSFPCVSIEEQDNYPLRSTQSTSSLENHAILMYEVNVYSNKAVGKKTECRAIAKTIDNAFMSMGFNRRMLNPIPNMDSATIYRMIARYQCVVDRNKTIYRR